MRSSVRALLLFFGLPGGLFPAAILPKIDLPQDSPVAVLSADYGDSSDSVRGGAMLLDLHAALVLRNSSQRHIRGLTLAVTAQDVSPGGKGSVTVASVDVAPGETLPVRVDLRLLRPLLPSGGAPVEISLDGVLFDDLGFYGPDRLNSRRMLTLSEREARRDRKYFKSLLADGGPERLQKEMLADLARISDWRNVDVQMVRGGRATAFEPEQEVQFAMLDLPDAPVNPLDGRARVAGNEARAPRLEILNRSQHPVRYVEIGWIVQDGQGRQVLAGTVPAELALAPGQKSLIENDTTLKLPVRPGQPFPIRSMTAFVSNVEFADGGAWIPNRADLADPRLRGALAPSAEEQRLVELYHKKGVKALIEDLKRY